MKIKIGIWGTCLTRDIFRSKFNNYRKYFEIVSTLERISLVSMMGDSIEFTEEDIQIYPLDKKNRFDMELLRQDLSKNFLKNMDKDIDYLIIDEVSEAYFGLIKINDNYITNNFWSYPKTKFYETISKNDRLSLNNNFIEYYDLWTDSCDKFFDYLHENFSNVKVILNKSRATSRILKSDGSYYVDEDFQKIADFFNPLLEILENYMETNHDVLVIDCTDDIFAYEDYIWGKSPFHLHDNFYNNAFEKILEVINDDQVNNKQLNSARSSKHINSNSKLNQESYNDLKKSSDNSKLNEYLEIKKYLFEEASVDTNFIDVSRLKDYFKYISKNNFENTNLNLQEDSFNELIKINKFIVENKNLLYEENKQIENEINAHYFDENANFLKKFLESRIDIKNYGNETNNIIILNDDNRSLNITQPSWFTDEEGIGTLVGSVKGDLDLSFKCVNDGNLVLGFKSVDFKDKSGNRIPIFIDYTEIVVNDEIIIDESQMAWHDAPFIFERKVKDGEIINIKAKWAPISYKTNIYLDTDYEKLIRNFYGARFDVKNEGDEDNRLILVDCDDSFSHIYNPEWFKGKNGTGTVVFSDKRKINISFKCVNDGNLKIDFKAMDLKYNDYRLPIFIEYTKIRIDDMDLIDGKVVSWHDNPFRYEQEVKNNQIVNIHVEWRPLSSESNLHLLQENDDYLSIYSHSRVDIKNYGDETNNIIMLDEDMLYNDYKPKWFADSEGIGSVVTSFNKELNLSFKCINDGKLKIKFRAKDFKDRNNNRIPIYIDYKKIEVDGEDIINGSTVLSHNNPLSYDKQVNDGQIVNIKLKWEPLNENSNCQNMLANSMNSNEVIKRLKKELEELNNENNELNNLKNELLSSIPWKKRFLYKIRSVKL
ncbi:DUF6270 domain-containing protein [uncultured Methanobrevibacter sp.]|uniref:DUF6270 domain-containing protein n=1 Tax=uncultured Methanobrevibacter sp. TaxID=253161 RepID=UPI0025DFA4C2|nr:DUF6270 domain-containing protein [uncultured Methanobrevibacter sp.]